MLVKAVKYAKSMIKNQRFFENKERDTNLKKVYAEIDKFKRTGRYPDTQGSKSPN